VKGRDWYDLVWYAGRDVHPNLPHLAARMTQTGHWMSGELLDAAVLRRLLLDRIAEVDFAAAADDVRPFITDSAELNLWSRDFFRDVAQRVTIQDGTIG
jgi:hypothetical protein